jgi:hypothetical protein
MWTYAYVNMMLCGMCIEYFLSYDVIYAIIWVLCHANGWNLCTNTRNATMRSIENMMANKKKIPFISALSYWDIIAQVKKFIM